MISLSHKRTLFPHFVNVDLKQLKRMSEALKDKGYNIPAMILVKVVKLIVDMNR